jgi:MOSC domain-containing protein YiiM
MGSIASVNLAVPEVSTAKSVGVTGINKQPVDGPVAVRAPGPRAAGGGSGLAGDQIFDRRNHGGDDQAVYAYAREDYAWWSRELGRPLPDGIFGENLTTVGVDVNGAMIGERWRIGADLLLQATFARIPCATFQAKMNEPHWMKTFIRHARPGAYLRVVEPGEVRAGDEVRVVHRPTGGLTIAEGFRAWTTEPELLPRLLDTDDAPQETRDAVRHRLRR